MRQERPILSKRPQTRDHGAPWQKTLSEFLDLNPMPPRERRRNVRRPSQKRFPQGFGEILLRPRGLRTAQIVEEFQPRVVDPQIVNSELVELQDVAERDGLIAGDDGRPGLIGMGERPRCDHSRPCFLDDNPPHIFSRKGQKGQPMQVKATIGAKQRQLFPAGVKNTSSCNCSSSEQAMPAIPGWQSGESRGFSGVPGRGMRLVTGPCFGGKGILNSWRV